jgi:hypothetical protein
MDNYKLIIKFKLLKLNNFTKSISNEVTVFKIIHKRYNKIKNLQSNN